MFKKIIALILACAMLFCVAGCASESKRTISDNKSENGLPKYEQQEFEICGLWAPRQMTEEAFIQYKEAGFNIVSFTNHDELPRTSEN